MFISIMSRKRMFKNKDQIKREFVLIARESLVIFVNMILKLRCKQKEAYCFLLVSAHE